MAGCDAPDIGRSAPPGTCMRHSVPAKDGSVPVARTPAFVTHSVSPENTQLVVATPQGRKASAVPSGASTWIPPATMSVT